MDGTGHPSWVWDVDGFVSTVVDTSLERIDSGGLYDGLWQTIPVMDNPLTVEIFPYAEPWLLYLKFHAVPYCTQGDIFCEDLQKLSYTIGYFL